MNIVLPLLVFSILLLVPLGIHNAFALPGNSFVSISEIGNTGVFRVYAFDPDFIGFLEVYDANGLAFLDQSGQFQQITVDLALTGPVSVIVTDLPTNLQDSYFFAQPGDITSTRQISIEGSFNFLTVDQIIGLGDTVRWISNTNSPFAIEVEEGSTISPILNFGESFSFTFNNLDNNIRVWILENGHRVNQMSVFVLDDFDGDGVPNDQDLCMGFDDSLDADGDGIPDDCDILNDLECGLGTIADNDLGQCVGINAGFDCGLGTVEMDGECVVDPSITDELNNCNEERDTCNTELATSQFDLDTCNADLTSCDTNLATCGTDLGTCNADLGTCGTDLTAAQADLSTAQTDLAMCLDELAICDGGDGEDKVVLCHKEKNTLSISPEDVADHLAHGDILGVCT